MLDKQYRNHFKCLVKALKKGLTKTQIDAIFLFHDKKQLKKALEKLEQKEQVFISNIAGQLRTLFKLKSSVIVMADLKLSGFDFPDKENHPLIRTKFYRKKSNFVLEKIQKKSRIR